MGFLGFDLMATHLLGHRLTSRSVAQRNRGHVPILHAAAVQTWQIGRRWGGASWRLVGCFSAFFKNKNQRSKGAGKSEFFQKRITYCRKMIVQDD